MDARFTILEAAVNKVALEVVSQGDAISEKLETGFQEIAQVSEVMPEHCLQCRKLRLRQQQTWPCHSHKHSLCAQTGLALHAQPCEYLCMHSFHT